MTGFRFVAKFQKSGDSLMKQLLVPVLALVYFTILTSFPVLADNNDGMIIELKTSDFELTQTDISALAVGESRTIETESGRVVDIIRTVDGAEIYIDGELLEMHLDHEGLHEVHKIEKHVEIICEDDENCEKNVFVIAAHDSGDPDWVTEAGDTVIIHENIELSCTDDEEGSSCSDDAIWITEDGQELHQLHEGEKGHKIIVIKKKILTED
jgi:hypothetical protein